MPSSLGLDLNKEAAKEPEADTFWPVTYGESNS